MKTTLTTQMGLSSENRNTIDHFVCMVKIRKRASWRFRLIVWGCIALWLSGCAYRFKVGSSPQQLDEIWDDNIYDINPYDPGIYYDGFYAGETDLPTPNFIQVNVAINNGRIVAIQLQQHPSWQEPQAQQKLIREVIAFQSTSAITPRNEGSEADQLLDAIDHALHKARRSPSFKP